jgi:hypothetical protein
VFKDPNEAKAFDLIAAALTQLSDERRVDIGPLARYIKRHKIGIDSVLERAISTKALTLYETQEIQTLVESYYTAQTDVNILDIFHYDDDEADEFEKQLMGTRQRRPKPSEQTLRRRRRRNARERNKVNGFSWDIAAMEQQALNGEYVVGDEAVGTTEYKALVEEYSYLRPRSLKELRNRSRLIAGPAAREFDAMLEQSRSENRELWRVPALEARCVACGKQRLVHAKIGDYGRAHFTCGNFWALHDEVRCGKPDERLRHTPRCKPGKCRHYHFAVYNADKEAGPFVFA